MYTWRGKPFRTVQIICSSNWLVAKDDFGFLFLLFFRVCVSVCVCGWCYVKLSERLRETSVVHGRLDFETLTATLPTVINCINACREVENVKIRLLSMHQNDSPNRLSTNLKCATEDAKMLFKRWITHGAIIIFVYLCPPDATKCSHSLKPTLQLP